MVMASEEQLAAEEFARTRLDALRRFGFVVCGSLAEADDLAQIAVIEVWRRWRTAKRDPEAYARRVIVTRNVSRWRRWRREVLVGADHPVADDPARDQVTDPHLWQALRSLRAIERTVVVLHVLYGYTFDEIAEVLDEPRGTVSSRYSRAKTTLRQRLRPAPPADPADSGLVWLTGGAL